MKSVEGRNISNFKNMIRRRFKVKVVCKLGFVLSFLQPNGTLKNTV